MVVVGCGEVWLQFGIGHHVVGHPLSPGALLLSLSQLRNKGKGKGFWVQGFKGFGEDGRQRGVRVRGSRVKMKTPPPLSLAQLRDKAKGFEFLGSRVSGKMEDKEGSG